MNRAMLVVLIAGCVLWVTLAMAAVPVATLPKTKINPKDGATMVLVPAGAFPMGTSEEELAAWLRTYPRDTRDGFSAEQPRHNVDLDAYYIYTTEVTVARYRKFCRATKRAMPLEPPWKWQDDHPIVHVTWDDAKAYADWAGVALPTEAEWEKAARGTDGRVFPWGNAWAARKCVNRAKSTRAVGRMPAGVSPYGCLDMAGNAWEWCADWYDTDYYRNAPARNPAGPATGHTRVIRGGSWYNSSPRGFRVASRGDFPPVYKFNFGIGFRCVLRVP